MVSPRTLRPLALSVTVLASLLTAKPVWAQDAPPAHIAVVDGAVSLARDGQSEPTTVGVPFLPGDRLQTDGGRAEVLFADGSALDIDEYSSVDLLAPALIRLLQGRIILTVPGSRNPTGAVHYQIDTPVASATTEGAGEYRVSLVPDPAGRSGVQVELAVVSGSGALMTERGRMVVRAGERSLARDAEPPGYPQAFNSGRFDSFDRWAAARRGDRLSTAASAQYLPPDLRVYSGTFDRYGAWEYEPTFGYVWYPTVAVGWRPYFNGYWSAIQPYGWTWIGLDTWGWPTHHYGRWGNVRDRWYWMPDRRWGPAWVTWAAAPGYVSWCPIGFDSRPVFALTASVGRNPWTGWVVVPRSTFGAHGAHVAKHAVAPRLIPASTPFIAQLSAPLQVNRAVPRPTVAATPGVAVPRAGAYGGASAASAASSQVVGRAGPGSHELKQPLPDERRAHHRDPYGVSVAPAPPDTRSQQGGQVTAPGTVPRWSAPSVAVPRWSAPSTGVPASSAPSTGVPAASAPSAGVPHGAAASAPVATQPREADPPDRKSTRLNSSHIQKSRMPSSA